MIAFIIKQSCKYGLMFNFLFPPFGGFLREPPACFPHLGNSSGGSRAFPHLGNLSRSFLQAFPKFPQGRTHVCVLTALGKILFFI